MLWRSLTLFLFQFVIGSCIDRLDDTLNADQGTIIIDGYISDQPGPYKIKIFKSVGSEANLLRPPLIRAKKVTLLDDAGNSEDLDEITLGEYGSEIEYWTKANGIKGQVGRKYSLRIELSDGTLIESEPDELKAVGGVTDIRYQFESHKPLQGPTEYGFKVFVDSDNETSNVRWRFTGTYVVETYPQFRKWPVNACRGPFYPPPCSGYESPNGFELVRVGDCTCCTCWVDDNESKPLLSNEAIKTNGRYSNVEIAYVPFNVWRFHYGKYLVKVEQMSLSDGAFEHWKIIKNQKEGSTSLFQPAFGKIATNFFSNNPDVEVAGYFYATSIKQKAVFISADDSTIPVPEFDRPGAEVCLFWDVCDAVWVNASRTPPPEWE